VDLLIRTIEADEFERFVTTVDRAFGSHPRPEEVAEWQRVNEPDRTLAAFDGDQMVGGAAADSFSVTVPGGREAPMAGVSAVGVAPSHRRRGLLTALMRRQLDDVRERGEALAGLWASEGSIYQRFGYGLAAFACSGEIEPGRTAFVRAVPEGGRIRLVEKAEALEAMPGVHDRIRLQQPGMLARSEALWGLLYADLEHWRDGASAMFYALYETTNGVDGYVAYRIKHDWSTGVPNGSVKVRELEAVDVRAFAALWRFCFDIDLAARIEAWPRPVDDPLLYLLAEPRRWSLRVGDGLWIRVVDVAPALTARRYRSEGRVVLEVRDAFCPWNERRYEVEGGPDGAECRPTARDPDLAVAAEDLGAAYLGGAGFGVLARAGRVEECRPGALRRADAMFGWDPLPWCNQLF
jgi:predicted acetyltransferase